MDTARTDEVRGAAVGLAEVPVVVDQANTIPVVTTAALCRN